MSKGPYRTDRLAGPIVERLYRLLLEEPLTVGQLGRKTQIDGRRIDRSLVIEARTNKTVVRVNCGYRTPLNDRVWKAR